MRSMFTRSSRWVGAVACVAALFVVVMALTWGMKASTATVGPEGIRLNGKMISEKVFLEKLANLDHPLTIVLAPYDQESDVFADRLVPRIHAVIARRPEIKQYVEFKVDEK